MTRTAIEAGMALLKNDRRIHLEKNIPVERLIRHALDEVEYLGADVRLTRAVILLGEALDTVADYIDAMEDLPK